MSTDLVPAPVMSTENMAARDRLNSSNSSRYLVISPNLEALLEHEERTRRTTGETWSPITAWSPNAFAVGTSGDAATTSTLPIGLPPPPRGPRKPRSPTAAKRAEIPSFASPLVNPPPPISIDTAPPRYSRTDPASLPTSPIASGSSSNPYINPAPTIADVLKSDDALVMEPLTSLSLDTLPRTESFERVAHSDQYAYSDSPSSSQEARPRDGFLSLTPPLSPVDGRQSRNPNRKQPSQGSQQSRYPSMPQVDKLLSIGKNALSRFSDGSAQNTDSEEQSKPPSVTTSWKAQPQNLRERARSKGKLLKLKDINVPKSPSTSPGLIWLLCLG